MISICIYICIMISISIMIKLMILCKKCIHDIKYEQRVRALQTCVQFMYLHVHLLLHVGGVELEIIVAHLGDLTSSTFLVVVHIGESESFQRDRAAVQLHARVQRVNLLQRLTQVRVLLHPGLVSGFEGEQRTEPAYIIWHQTVVRDDLLVLDERVVYLRHCGLVCNVLVHGAGALHAE